MFFCFHHVGDINDLLVPPHDLFVCEGRIRDFYFTAHWLYVHVPRSVDEGDQSCLIKVWWMRSDVTHTELLGSGMSLCRMLRDKVGRETQMGHRWDDVEQ